MKLIMNQAEMDAYRVENKLSIKPYDDVFPCVMFHSCNDNMNIHTYVSLKSFCEDPVMYEKFITELTKVNCVENMKRYNSTIL